MVHMQHYKRNPKWPLFGHLDLEKDQPRNWKGSVDNCSRPTELHDDQNRLRTRNADHGPEQTNIA